ncbi:MAG: SDR family oxidoreductase [Opitutaceae bacterium]|nr:SDR family oxidoreductase [Opitutaceae bacterium]MBP9913328.1 SDR family oxidoreductase [Opitutaceae bacterium]
MQGIAHTGIFITGGCGDIGQAVAKRFLAAGARVVLADMLPPARGRAAARALHPTHAAYVRCDVTRAASLDRAFAAALKFLGRLDTAICNAGMVVNEPFVEVTEKNWARTLAVNLTGSFLTAQRAARLMLKNPRRGTARRGTILFTGSWVQEMPWPGGASYCTSKGGQQMLAKIVAQELAPHGITAALVAPGMVYAGLTKKIYDRDKRFAKIVDRVVPLLRMSTAEEVAGSFLFLASDDGAYITGTTLLVDGGAMLGRRE